MGDRVRNQFNIYQNKWQSMEPSSKRRVGLGVAGLLVAIVVTLFFALRPNWIILEDNLTQAASINIQEVLEAEGIPLRVSRNYRRVEVREQDLTRAGALVFTSGALSPDQGFSFDDAFDLIGMSTSEDTRDQMFRGATESQIANALTQFDGIQSALVTLNLGNRNAILARESERPSASVVLTANIAIDSGMALALANTVANAVPGLAIENVQITNQYMRSIFDGSRVGDDRFSQSTDPDPVAAHALLMQSNVTNVLSPIFDGISVAAVPRVTNTEVTTQATSYSSPVEGSNLGLVSMIQHLEEMSEGTSGNNIPAGMDANDASFGQIFTAQQQANDFTAERLSYTRDYLHNRTQTHTFYMAGQLVPEDSTLSVTAYINVIHNESVLRQQGVLDDYGSFENYRIAHGRNDIINSEDFEGYEYLVELTANASGIPAENITLVIVHRPLFFETPPTTPTNWQTIAFFAVLLIFILLLAFGLLRGRRRDEEIEVEPELSVEDLLVTTRVEVETEERQTQKLQELAYAVDSEVKQQIDKFVNEKPEAVAQLLRTWINEGWE
ncbi:MAG: hypothetical protein FWE02_01830 [Defluviitaleaceae bacterium]|nr:hypothetical protein [Defluviitaleaceae bacterium]